MLALTRRLFLRFAAIAAASGVIAPIQAQQPAANGLSFLAIGDWGKPQLRANADRVATQMGLAADRLGTLFVISTGDNFYEEGVRDIRDPQWRSAFENVFIAPSLQCPWYAVLGNHDYQGKPDAEIAYGLSSNRWHMPARYYAIRQTLSDGTAADFFFLDTTPMDDLNPINRWLGADIQVQAQLDWLDTMLGASDAAWKIVVGHHTIYSGGEHGGTAEMVSRVKPLLQQHGVRIYINGHDHDLEHVEVDGIHYLTTGGGSEINPTKPIAGTLFAQGALGFLAATLHPHAMDIAFIDDAGQVLHQATIAR